MKLNNLLKELHANEETVTRLKEKHRAAKDQIIIARSSQMKAQILLDNAVRNCQGKIKTFKILDQIIAEFNFEVKQKASKAAKIKTKPEEQTMADVLACLKALPEAQRLAVIKAMEDKQQKGATEN